MTVYMTKFNIGFLHHHWLIGHKICLRLVCSHICSFVEEGNSVSVDTDVDSVVGAGQQGAPPPRHVGLHDTREESPTETDNNSLYTSYLSGAGLSQPQIRSDWP